MRTEPDPEPGTGPKAVAVSEPEKPEGPDGPVGSAGPEGSPEPGGKGERRLGSRAPRFIRSSRTLHMSWQAGVFLVGLAVVAAGAAMLVLPGPGWVVIFAGMAIWATEFVWAQLVLRWTKRKVKAAARKALDPRVRRRNMILTATGCVIIAAGLGYYVWEFGFRMPWETGA
ncbi:TIGR02611 family protein [Streptomyces zingiberis]|uniref:TIGR02611 family protein n=1 Tax=Streptomyces zingiberis TaxID=2053010 RepID=A0ABX1BUV8_9ACTN|nr:TIGR02611 family protein [Streptomyces zingiberis]